MSEPDMEYTVDISNAVRYLENCKEGLSKTVGGILLALGEATVDEAYDTAPVKTGRYRATIRYDYFLNKGLLQVIAGGIEMWGRMVDYAVYVERGSPRNIPRYVLRLVAEFALQTVDIQEEVVLRK